MGFDPRWAPKLLHRADRSRFKLTDKYTSVTSRWLNRFFPEVAPGQVTSGAGSQGRL